VWKKKKPIRIAAGKRRSESAILAFFRMPGEGGLFAEHHHAPIPWTSHQVAQ
jgi:hypothetical protein